MPEEPIFESINDQLAIGVHPPHSWWRNTDESNRDIAILLAAVVWAPDAEDICPVDAPLHLKAWQEADQWLRNRGLYPDYN